MDSALRLVADIGGTNARFALWRPGGPLSHITTLPTVDFETLEAATAHFLSTLPEPPSAACLAVACPTDNEPLQMTNHPWQISSAALRDQFGWRQLRLINDFEAVALALPHLSTDELLDLGGGRSNHQLPCAVMGPGTGLGVALLLPGSGEYTPVATEGGHAGLAPANEQELAIFRYWLERGATISRELFLSGPGLFRLYEALCALSGTPVRADGGAAVHALASEESDREARNALETFCALLGSACGDQALATGARGGIYLGGGILPRMRDILLQSSFRQRFEDKGPMRGYVSAISTQLIIADNPGLLGAAHCSLDI